LTKVLIVDDDLPVLASTARSLSSIGFETAITADRCMILDAIRQGHPDVVLLDVRMPGLDVEQLVRAIQVDPEIAGTRIVLFSAGIDAWEPQEQMQVADALEKPFKPAHVVAVITDAIAGPPKPPEQPAAHSLMTV